MTVEDTNTPTPRDNPKKTIRSERSSQTDDEEQQQGADKIHTYRRKISQSSLPEFDNLRFLLIGWGEGVWK